MTPTHGVLPVGQRLLSLVRMLFDPSCQLERSSFVAQGHQQDGGPSWYSNDTAGLSLDFD